MMFMIVGLVARIIARERRKHLHKGGISDLRTMPFPSNNGITRIFSTKKFSTSSLLWNYIAPKKKIKSQEQSFSPQVVSPSKPSKAQHKGFATSICKEPSDIEGMFKFASLQAALQAAQHDGRGNNTTIGILDSPLLPPPSRFSNSHQQDLFAESILPSRPDPTVDHTSSHFRYSIPASIPSSFGLFPIVDTPLTSPGPTSSTDNFGVSLSRLNHTSFSSAKRSSYCHKIAE